MMMDKNIKNTKDAFAKVFGSPGEAPIIIGLVKAFWPLLLICFLLGYIFRAILDSTIFISITSRVYISCNINFGILSY